MKISNLKFEKKILENKKWQAIVSQVQIYLLYVYDYFYLAPIVLRFDREGRLKSNTCSPPFLHKALNLKDHLTAKQLVIRKIFSKEELVEVSNTGNKFALDRLFQNG